jgi:flagellar hook-length control protein FliK
MNTSLLAIGSMFEGKADLGSAPVKAPADRGSHFAVRRDVGTPNSTQQSSSALPDNTPSANAPETKKTDNTFPVAQNEHTNKSARECGPGSCKKATAEVLQEAGDSGKSKRPGLAVQPETVQLALTRYAQNVEHGKEGIAAKVQPKAGYELAQSLVDSGAGELPPGPAKTAKSAQNDPLPLNQNEIRLRAFFSDASKKPLPTDTQPGESGNVDADGKTATGGEKQATALPSGASGSQETPPATAKELILKAVVDAESPNKAPTTSGEPTLADKPAVSAGQETPALRTGSPEAQGKPSDSYQKVTIGSGKSALFAQEPEKPTDNGAIVGRMSSESAGGSGEQSLPANNNLSGNSSLQKLNITELQVSTGQTKDNSNPASNNNPNPDFEQALPANSAQTPITKFFSDTSTEATKIVDSTSHSRPFPTIGEQILESIHSSLRQGDNRIAIRLNPPELGKVFIEFQEQQDRITGLLEVDKIQTRYEIEQVLPQIIKTLQDAGIQIKRFEVVLTDQPEQQPFRDQSLQDGAFQQNASTQAGNPDNKSADEWLENDSSYQDVAEPQMLVADDSIDMLV